MLQEPLHIRRAFSETMTLLIEARNYAAHFNEIRHEEFVRDWSLSVLCNSMRITSRLAHIMSWILGQKAVQAGEITLEQAARRFYIPDTEFYTSPKGNDDATLPSGLKELLRRSHGIYTRMLRLDLKIREELDPDLVDAEPDNKSIA